MWSPKQNRSRENHNKTPDMASEIGSVSSEINFFPVTHWAWHLTQDSKDPNPINEIWTSLKSIISNFQSWTLLLYLSLCSSTFCMHGPSPCRVSKGGFLLPEQPKDPMSQLLYKMCLLIPVCPRKCGRGCFSRANSLAQRGCGSRSAEVWKIWAQFSLLNRT